MTHAVRFLVVGNGKMAGDVLSLIYQTTGAEAVGAIGDPRQEAAQSRLVNTCAEIGIPYFGCTNINGDEAIATIRALKPTYLVSANNFQIFRGPALAVAERGIVNFHNGPLPRYGGLNACSWALFNGEKEHGVTWHLVDSNIDSGPILAQRHFPIRSEERAISLIARCIQEGVSLFEELISDLVSGTVKPVQQSLSQRLYYGLNARPFDGNLPWWDGADVLDRLARGLSFHPLPNTFYRPRVSVSGFEPVYTGEFSVESEQTGEVGTIRINGGGLVVFRPGGAIAVEALYDADGRELLPHEAAERYGIVNGARLDRP